MARVVAFINAILMGKLGGQVYSQNKSGAFVRTYKIPVNPKTQAQLNSRNRMRASAGAFSNLTALLKATWNVFAQITFNPLHKTNTGQYSGAAAYNALNLASMNFNDKIISGALAGMPTLTPLTFSGDYIIFSDNPPLKSIRPDIMADDNHVYPLTVASCSIKASGEITLNLNFLGTVLGGSDFSDLVDSGGLLYGVKLYISDPVAGIGNTPKNCYFQDLGCTGIISLSGGALFGGTGIQFVWDMATLKANFKYQIKIGDMVKATVVSVAENATQTEVGSIYVTIS